MKSMLRWIKRYSVWPAELATRRGFFGSNIWLNGKKSAVTPNCLHASKHKGLLTRKDLGSPSQPRGSFDVEPAIHVWRQITGECETPVVNLFRSVWASVPRHATF